MALPSSGPLSLSDIQTEFGGSNPISLNEYYAGGANVPAGTSGTYGAVPSSGQISIQNFYGTSKLIPSQQAYTTGGTYSWVAPAGVTTVSVVAVGGGGAGINLPAYRHGGGGGGLGYKNNYSTTPGSSYTVYVGFGETYPGTSTTTRDSYFVSRCVVKGGYGGNACGSKGGVGGGYTGTGGGNGGNGGVSDFNGCFCQSAAAGGGGAAGYSNSGGNGGSTTGTSKGAAGTGGGGGGGAGFGSFGQFSGAGGGGVGILGSGSNGAGGTPSPGFATGGGGGSCGVAGDNTNGFAQASGGKYGGGAGGGGYACKSGSGGVGAVRIIWPGNTRSFPSTCTGNL